MYDVYNVFIHPRYKNKYTKESMHKFLYFLNSETPVRISILVFISTIYHTVILRFSILKKETEMGGKYEENAILAPVLFKTTLIKIRFIYKTCMVMSDKRIKNLYIPKWKSKKPLTKHTWIMQWICKPIDSLLTCRDILTNLAYKSNKSYSALVGGIIYTEQSRS